MSHEFDYDEYETLASDKIKEVLAGISQFENTAELEDALLEIQRAEDAIAHVRAIKQRRAAFYDAEIKENQQKIDTLRDAVLDCMDRRGKKSLKFPGLGNANIRNIKGKWNVADEEALVEHLESLNMADEAGVEQTVKINKTKLNKVLNELDQNNNLGDFVEREEDKQSLTVKFEPKEGEAPEPVAKATKKVKTVKKEAETTSNEFDKLEI